MSDSTHDIDTDDIDTDEDSYGWVAEGLAAQRARRRRLLAFWGSAAAVLAGGLGVFGLMSLVRNGGSPEGTVAPGTADATGSVVAQPVALSWEAVPGDLGSVERLFAAADGTFYALSTAPGRTNQWPPPRALYTSADGEAWDATLLADDISAVDMALARGTVYVIGTAPGTGAVGDYDAMVSSSSDGGLVWESVVLPLEDMTAFAVESFTSTDMQIAAAGDVVVAMVHRNVELDLWSLVPQELLEEGNRGVEPTALGVDVVDFTPLHEEQMACDQAMTTGGSDGDELPEPCRRLASGEVRPIVVESYTWEELGLPADATASRSEVFVSRAGGAFEAASSPIPAGQHLAGLHSFEDGFIASTWGFAGAAGIWESSDGAAWAPVDGLLIDGITAAGTLGGDRVIIGDRLGSPLILWQGENGQWREADLAAALGGDMRDRRVAGAAIGPLGVVVAVQGFDEATGESVEFLHGVAPDEWAALPIEGVIGPGAVYPDWVVVGPNEVLIRVMRPEGPQPANFQVIGRPGG